MIIEGLNGIYYFCGVWALHFFGCCVYSGGKKYSFAYYKGSCICFACIIAPTAEANHVRSTMPVINISGARQVWTTSLSECMA